MGWHEHDRRLFRGTERSSGPATARISSRVDSGARRRSGQARARGQVADVGCGHGASTVIMAKAFPTPSSSGSTTTPPRSSGSPGGQEAGVADRITFEVASAKEYPGTAMTWCACSTACTTWATRGPPPRARDAGGDGTWMIVEPFANDRLEDNLNPVGRVFYGASTVICTPASLDQEVGLALGAQAGEARLRDVLTRAASPACAGDGDAFNLILEARP